MTASDLDLTMKVYDAVVDPLAWQPVLDEIVDRAGAHGSSIFEWSEEGANRPFTAPLHSGRYPSNLLAFYLEKCVHLEAHDQDLVRQKPPVVVYWLRKDKTKPDQLEQRVA